MTMGTTYITGTQEGERKRKEEKNGENTNTTRLARSGRTLKRQGKRKADDGPNINQRSGGRTEAPDTTYKARATPTSAREGPQPNLTREHETHEIGDPWGTS